MEYCPATGLNLYKVVANGAIGTGPNFVDPASLGVPGFNEFYYLRHYPDAAAAVQAGQYPNGLSHYLAVGKAKGYLAHAPNALGTPWISSFRQCAYWPKSTRLNLSVTRISSECGWPTRFYI